MIEVLLRPWWVLRVSRNRRAIWTDCAAQGWETVLRWCRHRGTVCTFERCFCRPARLDMCWATSEEGMMVESAGDVLSIDWVDGFWHVQDLGLPSVLPAGLGPKQALVPYAKYHLNKLSSTKVKQQQLPHCGVNNAKKGNMIGKARMWCWGWGKGCFVIIFIVDMSS